LQGLNKRRRVHIHPKPAVLWLTMHSVHHMERRTHGPSNGAALISTTPLPARSPSPAPVGSHGWLRKWKPGSRRGSRIALTHLLPKKGQGSSFHTGALFLFPYLRGLAFCMRPQRGNRPGQYLARTGIEGLPSARTRIGGLVGLVDERAARSPA